MTLGGWLRKGGGSTFLNNEVSAIGISGWDKTAATFNHSSELRFAQAVVLMSKASEIFRTDPVSFTTGFIQVNRAKPGLKTV